MIGSGATTTWGHCAICGRRGSVVTVEIHASFEHGATGYRLVKQRARVHPRCFEGMQISGEAINRLLTADTMLRLGVVTATMGVARLRPGLRRSSFSACRN